MNPETLHIEAPRPGVPAAIKTDLPAFPARTIPINAERRANVQGRIRVEVLDAKTGDVVEDKGWQKNLILDKGLDLICNVATNQTLYEKLSACHAGTGTTATKQAPNGTYAQSGTTVTRSTGSGTFEVGDVGRRIRFSTGEQAKIVSRTSSTEIEVDRSATVAATTLEIFRTNDLGLVTYVKGTNTLSGESGANQTTVNSSTGDVTHQKTFIFSAESGSVNYTEIGIANNVNSTTGGSNNMFSRVVLASAVSLTAGQQLRVTYQVTLSDSGPLTPTARTLDIPGWPYVYEIVSISSNGSAITLTLDKNHHYIVGGKVNIDGALPVKTAITAIASDSSTFTVTAVGHGKSIADSIEIEDCTVTDYNGTWTIDDVPDADTIVVLSAANPGAASDGTVRLTTPGTWYDGEWTIASVSGATLTITSSITPGPAGASGTAYNNLNAVVMHPFYGWTQQSEILSLGADNKLVRLYEGLRVRAGLARNSSAKTPSAFPWNTSAGGDSIPAATTMETYVNGSGRRVNTFTWGVDEGNFTDIKQIWVYFLGTGVPTVPIVNIFISFDERQRKDSGYALELTFTRTVEQILA